MKLPALNSRQGFGAILIAVNAVCVIWIAYRLWGVESSPRKVADKNTALAVGAPLAPAFKLLRPGMELSATAERPLFSPSRRAAATATAEAAGPPAMQKGRYKLAGVSISAQGRVALLRDATTNQIVRVFQGQELNGARVAEITPRLVILRQGRERDDIPLVIAPAPGNAPVPPPTSGQAVPNHPTLPPTAAPMQHAPGPSTPAPAAPPAEQAPVAVEVPSGPPRNAIDIANEDPITEADLAEAAARREAKKQRKGGAASAEN